MCGRYFLQRDPAGLADYYGRPEGAGVPNFPPNWNVAPTQDMPVLRRHPETGERRLDVLRWGLVPRWSRDASGGARMINARAEGVAGKPSFRDAFVKRRCLVPADGFYEWLTPTESAGKTRTKDPKQPYAVALRNGEPMTFAGLWEGWKDPDGHWLRTYTIITTEANEKQRPLHHRMPVILPREAWPAWLGEEPADDGDLSGLLRPCPPEWLACWPVPKRVNSVRENDETLIRRDPSVEAPPGLDDPSPYEGTN